MQASLSSAIDCGAAMTAPGAYCRPYRPAACHAEAVDTSTSHVGFRCVDRPAE
jgi:formylglycine-generating enzyme required for sulfatase activity